MISFRIQHRGGGLTYFRPRTGFSINEGMWPNIHVSWWDRDGWRLYIYVAICPWLKWIRLPKAWRKAK